MDILFYSKYSKHCVDLLNIINVNGVTCFTQLCIDEPRIRQQLLKSKKIKIRQVPCILLVEDLKFQTYEGDFAFKLVNTIIETNLIKQSQQSQQSQQQQSQQTKIQYVEEQKVPYTSIDDIIEDENEKEDVADDNEKKGSPSFQDRYADMHISSPTQKLKPKDNKKISGKASEIENERNLFIESTPPENRAGVKMTSINDVGLDLTKGKPPTPIQSVKTGEPINISKLMSSIEDRN